MDGEKQPVTVLSEKLRARAGRAGRRRRGRPRDARTGRPGPCTRPPPTACATTGTRCSGRRRSAVHRWPSASAPPTSCSCATSTAASTRSRDRCPHRGVPLSLGKEEFPGTLTCAYHGWTYRLSDGELVAVITDGPDSPICGKVRVPPLPGRRASRPGLGLHRRSPAPHPLTAQLPEELVDAPPLLHRRSDRGPRPATGACSPRTASTRATPSTSIATRSGGRSR